MDILWKGVIGGVMTALIAWLSKKGNVLPGILPLFPTFAVIALYLVGSRGDANGFQEACKAGMKTIPAYLTFLVICYFSINKFDFRMALLIGLAFWFIAALVVFLVPRFV
jgi:membrane protein GlpM